LLRSALAFHRRSPGGTPRRAPNSENPSVGSKQSTSDIFKFALQDKFKEAFSWRNNKKEEDDDDWD
jgi:hypothetical protein